MRALETGRYLLRATNTGVTAIINPQGQIVKQAPIFKTTVLTDYITPIIGLTPYARFGDKPTIIVLISLFFMMLWLTKQTNTTIRTNKSADAL